MKKDFTINGMSFKDTIQKLELMMCDFHNEQFKVLVSARDFMEWLQEETENKVNTSIDCAGRTVINITPDDVQWIETPNGNYQFMNGDLVKVPKPLA